jgi:hypothetical protein
MKTTYMLAARDGFFFVNNNKGYSTDRTDATECESIEYLLSLLQRTVSNSRTMNGCPAISDLLRIVRVDRTTLESTTVRRLLTDCEGCKEGETIKYALKYNDIFYRGIASFGPLDEARLYGSAEDAVRFKVGNSHADYGYVRVVRVGLTLVSGKETITETVLV